MAGQSHDCIVEAEQQGRTANLPIGGAAMTVAVFLVLISVILYGVSVILGIIGIVASLGRRVVVVVVADSHSLCCRHRPCLGHPGSRCCCRQRRRCSPLLIVGCCAAYSVVCRPICHPPLLSSCDCQHFCRQPPSPTTDLCQQLSYPSTLPIPSMVDCCVLRPPSSISTEPPS